MSLKTHIPKKRFEGKSWVPVHTTATKKEAIAWAAKYERENPHTNGIIAPFPKGVIKEWINGRAKRWVCYVQEWTVRRK
jgi:hypothetical protein